MTHGLLMNCLRIGRFDLTNFLQDFFVVEW